MRLVTPKVLAVVAAAVATGAITFAVTAAPSDSKSQLHEVPGPAIGPSGQTGELHYLEGTPATEYKGGAIEFGPYRLLPAGTRAIRRGVPVDKEHKTTSRSSDLDVVRASSLFVAPPTGFSLASGWVVTGDGFDIEASFTWTDAGGATVWGAINVIDDWQLPLDVHLNFDDSPLVVRPAMIAGYYAFIEEPRTGPAPNSGQVGMYIKGRGLFLRSPDLGQDRLEAIAAELAKTIGGTP